MPDPAPDTFIIRILGPDARPVGVGALVGKRHVLTCAHVVNTALGLDVRSQSQPDAPVKLDFPLASGKSTLRATVERWLPPPREGAAGDDIAGLVLTDKVAPSGTAPARLAVDPPRSGQAVRVFGYPAGRPDGAWVTAAVRGLVGGGRLQLDSDSALRVQRGFSGSPVFDDGIGRVVGLIASAPPGAADRDSYAIGADQLRLSWPELLAGPWQRVSRDAREHGRSELTILHISDTRLSGKNLSPADRAEDLLFNRLHRDLDSLASEHELRPDLMVVSGNLAAGGLRSEFQKGTEFLGALCEAAEIPRRHVAIVPGNRDINRKACAAYFADAEADEAEPTAPYWPKWRQFVTAFEDFYAGVGTATFTPDEPWTLFEMPELAVVVAGLNSTMAESHEDHYGWVGEHQLQWFADRLADYRDRGWLRLAAIHHNIVRSAVADDENLRDTDDLNRILGEPGLANLLLHGYTHDARLHLLLSGLPALAAGSASVEAAAGPAEVPTQYQLITVRRDGFTRHGRRYAPGQRRWTGDTRISDSGSDWRDTRPHWLADVDAALPPQVVKADYEARTTLIRSANRQRSGEPAGRDDIWATDSADTFLALVAEATRVRFPVATVTERPDGGYLRVSHPLPGGGAEQLPVGVIEGPATEAAVDGFIEHVHSVFAAADPSVRSELVYGGPRAPSELVARTLRRGVRLRSMIEYQGLLDLRPLDQAQRERLTADQIYPAWLYVQHRYRMARGSEIRNNLLEQVVDWLAAEDARLAIVLGDFGRGKTAFLRQLTRTLPAELPGLQPILVELRNLEKAPTLDELLGQYLFRQGVEDINPARLRYMIHSGRVGLLFDGFDELELRVGYENAADYLQRLLASVTGSAKVVLTSRTQHFRSTEQVMTALGERVSTLAGSRVVVLEDFSEAQILAFLANLFDDPARAEVRFELLEGIGNLLELARNPRMLAFVAQMDEDRLRAVQAREGEIRAAELYREIIDFWLTEEVKRQEHRRGLRSLDKAERLSACTALALRLWAFKDLTIGLNELSAEVAATLTGLAERGYSEEQASHSIGSGSLLVRTDDGAFTFVHQSIMEWLVAEAAARSLDNGSATQILTMQRMSTLMAEFFADLAGHPAALSWAEGTLADPQASETSKQNALAVLDQVRPVGSRPGAQNLAGVDLRGQDLTGRDLRGANLRGANLSGMRLADTDMASADLTSADLTGVRVVRGSLHDANLTASRWDGAALLGTEIPGELAASAELKVAAVAGLDPADAMIHPVGIPSSVAFSPDGRLVAVAIRNAVELIDAADGRPIRILPGHNSLVYGLAFSPDGSLLATAASDGTTQVCNVATGTITFTVGAPSTGWQGFSNHVHSVAFSPDGTRLAITSSDGTARILDLGASTARTTTPPGHPFSVSGVTFSSDGTLLAIAFSENLARIWDLATGAGHATLQGHTRGVHGMAFSPDGTLLAAASLDYSTRIWDLATGAIRTTLQGPSRGVHSIAFSPDGTLLATVASGTTRIWDLATGSARTTLQGHIRGVHSMAFSPDGTQLAAASSDGTARIWDLATGTDRIIAQSRYLSMETVAVSPDGALLATGSSGGTARIWDLATATPRTTLRGHVGPVRGMAFSPHGALLATTSSDCTIQLWSPVTGDGLGTLRGHLDQVKGMAFSPEGTLLATASSDGTARVWDLDSCAILTTLRGHMGPVNAVAFSPDGKLLATSAGDGTTRIWDLAWDQASGLPRRGEQPVTILRGHTDPVRDLAFSPDGGSLITTSDNGTWLWDVAAGEARNCLHGYLGEVLNRAFSPDGTLLAIAYRDGMAGLHALTEAARDMLPYPVENIYGTAVSLGSTVVASIADDGRVRIWDLATVTLQLTLTEFPEGGYLALLPDGYKLDGNTSDDVWWAIKLCRFIPGELDPYVPRLRQLPRGAPVSLNASGRSVWRRSRLWGVRSLHAL